MQADTEDSCENPCLYAVGDVISKKYRQITMAVADGTIATIAIVKELN